MGLASGQQVRAHLEIGAGRAGRMAVGLRSAARAFCALCRGHLHSRSITVAPPPSRMATVPYTSRIGWQATSLTGACTAVPSAFTPAFSGEIAVGNARGLVQACVGAGEGDPLNKNMASEPHDLVARNATRLATTIDVCDGRSWTNWCRHHRREHPGGACGRGGGACCVYSGRSRQ